MIKSRQKGFTLIEMIISMGIFTLVAVIAVGALLKVIDAGKKAQSLKTSINNLNFALESMSREMRVGSNYYCMSSSGNSLATLSPDLGNCSSWTSSATGANWTIYFYSSNQIPPTGTPTCHLIYAYRYSGTLEKAEQTACGSAFYNFAPVISPDIAFTMSRVKVVPGNPSVKQSYAQFQFQGFAGQNLKEKNRTYFDLKTTVSQRLPG